MDKLINIENINNVSKNFDTSKAIKVLHNLFLEDINLINEAFNKKINIGDTVFYKDKMGNVAKSKFAGYDNNGNSRLERIRNLGTDLQIIDDTNFFGKLNKIDMEDKLDEIIEKNKKNVFLVEGGKMDYSIYKEGLKIENILKQLYEQANKVHSIEIESKLLEEAKKYKTFEEFIGKQDKVYHGTNALFDVFDKNKQISGRLSKGDYFTRIEEGAKGFGSNIIERYYTLSNPFKLEADVVCEDGSVIFAKSTKEQFYDKFPEIRNLDWKDLTEFLINKGYDGIDAGEYVTAFDGNKLKTKEQMRDLYEQAHEKIELLPEGNELENFIRKNITYPDTELNFDTFKFETIEGSIYKNYDEYFGGQLFLEGIVQKIITQTSFLDNKKLIYLLENSKLGLSRNIKKGDEIIGANKTIEYLNSKFGLKIKQLIKN